MVEFKKILDFIKLKSKIIEFDEDIIINFGINYKKLKLQNKDMCFVDIAIFTLSESKKTKIITADKHFKNLENVIFLN